MRLYSDYTSLHTNHEYKEGIFCSVCGREIHHTEDSYSTGDESVCKDEGCMAEFFENNADQMLIDFAEEKDLKEEAKAWFFENLG